MDPGGDGTESRSENDGVAMVGHGPVPWASQASIRPQSRPGGCCWARSLATGVPVSGWICVP